MRTRLDTKENTLSKRKTGALRQQEQDTRYSHSKKHESHTFYIKEIRQSTLTKAVSNWIRDPFRWYQSLSIRKNTS